MKSNVINNEILHTVEVSNDKGNRVLIDIDFGDMIQVNAITEMFTCFDDFKDIIENGEELNKDNMLELTKKLANKQKELNSHMCEAFGDDLLQEVFSGRGSIVSYLTFFELLKNEIEKAEVKITEYSREVRKKDVIDNMQGHNKKVL